MPASVAPVSAEIGLNDRLPHSFSQISSRMSPAHRRLQPAVINACAIAATRGVFSPTARPARIAPVDVADDPGGLDLGRRIDDRPNGALSADARAMTPPGSTVPSTVPSCPPPCR